CALGCMVDLYIKDGQIVKARGSEQSVPANGWICRKGKFEFEKVAAGKRLTSPLIRDHRQGEDNYREVSWDEAINFIKEKLSKIIHESGAESLGVIGSPWATNEESFLLQKLAREIWKTPHIDLSVSHEYPLSIRAVRDSLPKFKGFISDLGAADCIVAIGADLSEDYPVAAQEIKNAVRYRGAKLFLLACDDPDLASMAALNLRPKPGSEPIFFRGLLRAILEENPALKNQAQAIVEDFSEYSAEYVYDKIGVNAEELLTFVRIYNHAKRVTALFDEGFLCHENSEYILDVFLELVSLSGQFSSKGTGIISLQKFPNLQGALSMGVNPYYLPGYKKAEKQGFSCREMLNQAATGKIRGLYIMGEVRKDMLHQLRKVEFLVVQGLSLSETAKYADVILPGAAIAEKAGTFTAADGRVQPLQQAINPPQGVWDDCRIIKAVATAFNDS
ncbi:MAG: molybdopterin-dependent oxidoreductase, partial [Firmicutes bacterium]|nr:molybdopterin-dependent oxidoreductase [Bacillota bacterium]